jgi:hypothetical protein
MDPKSFFVHYTDVPQVVIFYKPYLGFTMNNHWILFRYEVSDRVIFLLKW